MDKGARNAYVFLAISLIIVLTFSVVHLSGESKAKSEVSDLKSLENTFRTLVKEVGAEQAYAEFRNAYGGTAEKHMVGHVLGAFLWESMKLKGLAVCDSSFAFGCYHEYIARALLEYGPEETEKLGRLCFEGAKAGCPHGIGHGLFEYFGAMRITDALHTCDRLKGIWKTVEHCERGVFMAYNIPSPMQESFGKIPSTTIHTPYEPCDTNIIPDAFKTSCYFSLPQRFLHEGNPPEDVSRYCATVPPSYRKACFLGIGIDLPSLLSFEQDRIIEICETMPDKESGRWCLESSMETLESHAIESCVIREWLGLADPACPKHPQG